MLYFKIISFVLLWWSICIIARNERFTLITLLITRIYCRLILCICSYILRLFLNVLLWLATIWKWKYNAYYVPLPIVNDIRAGQKFSPGLACCLAGQAGSSVFDRIAKIVDQEKTKFLKIGRHPRTEYPTVGYYDIPHFVHLLVFFNWTYSFPHNKWNYYFSISLCGVKEYRDRLCW